MCILFLAYGVDPSCKLVICSNRDERYTRTSLQLQPWDESPEIWGGRDAAFGGTWLGFSLYGRFGILTNFRGADQPPDARSRGHVVADFLRSSISAQEFIERELIPNRRAYAGYNVIFWDGSSLCYYTNQDIGDGNGTGFRVLEEGRIYGLSNHLLDTPWPKVVRGKALLSEALAGVIEEARAHVHDHVPVAPAHHEADVYDGAGVAFPSDASAYPTPSCGPRPSHSLSSPMVSPHLGPSSPFISDGAIDHMIKHVLRDDKSAEDKDLPDYGANAAWERALSSIFVNNNEHYGTREQTVFIVSGENANHYTLVEESLQNRFVDDPKLLPTQYPIVVEDKQTWTRVRLDVELMPIEPGSSRSKENSSPHVSFQVKRSARTSSRGGDVSTMDQLGMHFGKYGIVYDKDGS